MSSVINRKEEWRRLCSSRHGVSTDQPCHELDWQLTVRRFLALRQSIFRLAVEILKNGKNAQMCCYPNNTTLWMFVEKRSRWNEATSFSEGWDLVAVKFCIWLKHLSICKEWHMIRRLVRYSTDPVSTCLFSCSMNGLTLVEWSESVVLQDSVGVTARFSSDRSGLCWISWESAFSDSDIGFNHRKTSELAYLR